MNLYSWSWLFLVAYIGLMILFGVIGSRRVTGADDFAVARRSYGPFVLALAFASTAASGATFLGLPGLTYSYGMSTIWLAFLYPVGIYLGVLICQRTIGREGNEAGARSIPEYLGERYQSEALRVSAAIFSLMLLFYLAGQLLAGLVMFEIMLGIPKLVALGITVVVLLAYVTLGGAHADILTDGVQGLLMVILAVAIIVMFLLGVGAGGWILYWIICAVRTAVCWRYLIPTCQLPHRRGRCSRWSSHTYRLACCHISATSCGRSRTKRAAIAS